MVSMALTPFLRALLQAGQIRCGPSSDGETCLLEVVVEVLKCTGIRVLSERWWVEFSSEAGQNGWSLWAFAVWAIVEDGVNDGTQKDGSEGLFDCMIVALVDQK